MGAKHLQLQNWLKNYKYDHVIAVCSRLILFHIKEIAMNIPLERKDRPGRHMKGPSRSQTLTVTPQPQVKKKRGRPVGSSKQKKKNKKIHLFFSSEKDLSKIYKKEIFSFSIIYLSKICINLPRMWYLSLFDRSITFFSMIWDNIHFKQCLFTVMDKIRYIPIIQ
ncbi:hypothetical protein BpHYR1_054579 [Brachionus plicatilis]|uniref:Uncharacterized protein n=1 Tax=Brachionus plicatilis TaxID=10195 RepID=A0A3M7PXW9_BRAPC|nr:hypothetical protein BpHYR1_054579 [Brachionus plicatilis]